MPERRRIRVDGYPVPGRVPEAEPAEPADPTPAIEETCNCPHLDADDWDGVESDWSDIAFVKATASALLGIVNGLGNLRQQLEAKAAKAHVAIAEEPMFLLGGGQFRRPAMLEVEGAGPATKGVERPGGVVFTRLLPAPPGKVRPCVRAVEEEARERYGRAPDHTWLWYLTCRVCSEARNFETLVVAHYKHS
jgi:hypothetical protein